MVKAIIKVKKKQYEWEILWFIGIFLIESILCIPLSFFVSNQNINFFMYCAVFIVTIISFSCLFAFIMAFFTQYQIIEVEQEVDIQYKQVKGGKSK